MTTYTTRKTATRKAVTPQPVSQPIAKREADMTVNHTAGYVFKLDEMKALERFLILGVTGPTYYVTKDQGMAEANGIITAALQANFYGAIDLACDISQDGRAAKNEQSIYVLARAIATGRADEAAYALARMDKVVRIGTHLHHLMQYLKDGQALSGSRGKLVQLYVNLWLAKQGALKLAYQANKYQTRDGWSWRDTLRLVHPKPQDAEFEYVYGRMCGKRADMAITNSAAYNTYHAFDLLRNAASAEEAAQLIGEYTLPLEACPTQFKKDQAVWNAVLPHLGLEALIRNLANMGEYGVLKQGNWEFIEAIVAKLEDTAALKRSRLHPAKIWAALKMYSAGRRQKHQGRGELVSWDVVPQVIAALDKAFYEAFANVEPTGKVNLLALDISGSMGCDDIAGLPNTSPREATALLAMLQVKTENRTIVKGFSHQLIDLGDKVARGRRLQDVVQDISGLPFGSTDVGLPIRWALQGRVPVDVFQIYTDNEVNTGVHPTQLLNQYRATVNPHAKSAGLRDDRHQLLGG